MGLLARLPVRLRLTIAFTVVMAAVLAGTGLFLYLRLGAALDDTIDQSLRERSGAATALVRAGDSFGGREDGLVQVLDANGSVVAGAPGLERPLLSGAEVEEARARPLVVAERAVPGSDEPARLLATVVQTARGERLVVVGASLEQRGESLGGLLAALLIGGPLALVLAALAGYGLAAAALRPVESMRLEAEAVSAAEPGRRLPLPRAADEVRRLGETLNRMLARLEAAIARERRFVADASHELRTPLAALRTELELALRREREPAELEDAVRSAAEEVERLCQLAEDLLVLARADEGKLPIRCEPLAVAGLFADVRERYAHRAAAAARPLEVEQVDGLELTADRLRLQQALGNLVENAFRHGAGRVLFHARRRNGSIELHVRDEGPGFAPGVAERAFEPFSRAEAGRSGQGAGLGLAIVDVIARAHGGSAHVANVPGGADAWIALPADPRA